MTETIGAYHPRHIPVPDGWRQTAELPGFHALRYIWIEPMQDAEGHDQAVMNLLRQHEGEVRAGNGQHVAYDDGTGLPIKPGTHVAGNPTIGWGILLSAGGGIDNEEAEYLARRRLRKFRERLDREISWWRSLPRGPWLALNDMVYNLGPAGLLQFRKMLAALKTGDYETAAAEALDSRWAAQVGVRADKVARLIREPVRETT